MEEAGLDKSHCDLVNCFRESKKSYGKNDLLLAQVRIESILKTGIYGGVIACGRIAWSVVEKIRFPAYMVLVEHPSGLNRNLNDPNVVAECISKISMLRESLGIGSHHAVGLQNLQEHSSTLQQDDRPPARSGQQPI